MNNENTCNIFYILNVIFQTARKQFHSAGLLSFTLFNFRDLLPYWEKKRALAFICFCHTGLTRLFILTWEYNEFNTLINCTVLIDGCVALSRWSGKRVHVLSLHIELSVSLWMNVCRWGGLYYWWVSAGLQMGGSVDTVMILMYSQFGSASRNSCFVRQKTIQTA